MATHNADITVNVYGEKQSVDVVSFDRIVHATDDVEVGFTDLYRIYESYNDAAEDADLSTGAKAAASAFFSQERHPPDLAIAAVDYDAGGSELETSLDTLLASWTDFYALTCMSRADADQQQLAEWAAANDRLAFGQSSTAAIIAGTGGNLFETLSAASNDRAAALWHDDDTELADLAWAAEVLWANPDEKSTVAFDKTLVGITAPSEATVDATEKGVVRGYNGSLYLPYYGPSVVRLGDCFGGKSVADRILEDWFKARLQTRIAAMQIRESQAGSKVAMDDDGIGLAESEIRAQVTIGERVGHFVPGTLVINVPKYEDLSAAEIASETVVIPFTVRKRVGAKFFTLNVGVTF